MKTKGINRDNTTKTNYMHTKSAVPPKTDDTARNTADNLPPLPEAPPNYRGMIYDMAETEREEVFAEGLNRLAGEDESSGYSRNIPNQRQRRTAPVFSHLDPPKPPRKPEDDTCIKGLKSLAEGMEKGRFSPEDMLICAMIILMLNSGSEDDILMILVLMMLL